MTKVILTIGIPGSGKTTFAKKYCQENNFSYICPDDIRYDRFNEEFGDEEEQTEIWRETRLRMEQSLKSGKDFLIDSTMADRRSRTNMINFIKSIDPNSEIIAIQINTPLEICLERNSKRGQPVPEKVIERMSEYLLKEPISDNEGFSSIIKIDMENLSEQLSETKIKIN